MATSSVCSSLWEYREIGVSAYRMTRWERWALALAIVEIPLQVDKYFLFRPDVAVVGSIGGINISLTTLCIVLMYAVWAVRGAQGRTGGQLRWHVGWPAVLFCLFSGISYLAAWDRQLVVFELVLLLQAYLLYFYAANRVHVRADLRWVLAALLVSGLLQSLLLVGGVVAWWLGSTEVIHLGPIQVGVSETGRAEGTLQSSTGAGSILTLLVLTSAPLVALRGERWRWLSRGALLLIATGLPAVALTQSRAAIATCVTGLGMITIGLWYRGWLPRHVRWGLVAASLVSLVPVAMVLRARVLADDKGAAASRIHLSQIAFELIEDHGLLGVGAGNAPVAMQAYASQAPYRSEWFYTVHCKYLIVWAETGVIGLTLFVLFLGVGIWRAGRLWASPVRWQSIIGMGLATALSFHALHMFVDLFTGRPHVELLWFTLGLVYAISRTRQESSREELSQLVTGASY